MRKELRGGRGGARGKSEEEKSERRRMRTWMRKIWTLLVSHSQTGAKSSPNTSV